VVKIGQASLISKDVTIYDRETGFSICRNSDLIEEMGQVEFIFSDKTGTLTCNVMEFKQCTINGKIYASYEEIKRGLTQTDDEQEFMYLFNFFKLLAVCHTVVIDYDPETE